MITSSVHLYCPAQVHSPVTEVYLAPSFVEEEEDGGDIILEEDGVELRVVFRAKPWPQEEDLTWSLQDAEDSLIQVQGISMGTAIPI